ncbi:MAG: hypothetical protein M3466_02685 [Gemmatimonadota bacterium]|nr:hypothetical protein [Gemmatimonadota bacterium]
MNTLQHFSHLLVALLVGCGSSDFRVAGNDGRDPNSSVVKTCELLRERIDLESTELILKEYSRLAVPGGAVPLAIAALDEQDVWALDQKTRRLFHATGVKRERSPVAPGDSGISMVMAGDGRMLAARGSSLFRLTAGSSSLSPLLELDPSDGLITGAAEDLSRLWVAVQQDSGTTLTAFARSNAMDTTDAIHKMTLTGAYRLHPFEQNQILATQTTAPFELLVITSSGTIAYRKSALSDSRFRLTQLGTRRGIVSLSAIPLSCSFVLQLLVDLRGDTRWFVIHDVARSRISRVRRVSASVGFTQALPRDRLLGFDDGAGRGEIVIYEWYWSFTE